MMLKLKVRDVVWFVTTIVFFCFLLLPLLILIVVSFNPVAMVFPPQGFTLHWYRVILDKPEFLSAAWASAVIGIMTAVISTTVGVLAAIGLHRYTGRLRKPMEFALLSPLFFPAVIVALAIFQLMMAMGMMTNLVVLVGAHVVVTMPYPVRNVTAQLSRFDRRLEEAAMTVGATPRQALLKVTIPLLRASIVPSLIITFVLSWNNYTVSAFLAQTDWTTLPLQLRAYVQYEYEPFLAAMSTVLILISAVFLFIVERTFGMSGRGKV
ncbi:ABC transporter permease [Collimonas sp.]|jgi:putative spermidine/putrescine transport system permease protein|uniref:ABC transporter permease n=1 Tax=Collimonas sp. TaxID=1963772 RepID=UPI002C9096B3|nr:ABC transporter permease [Collimonas sp.]HWW06364.1 ABC transporter permease [Collimonas sp.]